MASLTWWIWVWINSRSWWWTGRPGVLQSTGSLRVGQDRVTELNWLGRKWKLHLINLLNVGVKEPFFSKQNLASPLSPMCNSLLLIADIPMTLSHMEMEVQLLLLSWWQSLLRSPFAWIHAALLCFIFTESGTKQMVYKHLWGLNALDPQVSNYNEST